MKVTFYGSIALAAIAAKNAQAASVYEDEDDLAQTSLAIKEEPETQATTLASLESEVAVQSEGELDSWSEADLESDSDADLELDGESMSELDEISEDYDLAQTNIDADADAEIERHCPCCARYRARQLAWRRRMAAARAARIRRIRAAQARRRKILAARKAQQMRAR